MHVASTGAAGADKPKRRPRLKPVPRPVEDEAVEQVDETTEEASTSPRVGKKRGPYNVQRIEKKPVTYRLPPDVIEYIDQARDEAAARGDRLTKDEAITMAVRAFWGGKRQRRR